MPEYNSELKGVLFKNEDKNKKENAPLYKGKCQIDGKCLYISAWVNKSKDSSKTFMSLKFQEPKQKTQQNETMQESDLPF
jgi:hypothetical protein